MMPLSQFSGREKKKGKYFSLSLEKRKENIQQKKRGGKSDQ